MWGGGRKSVGRRKKELGGELKVSPAISCIHPRQTGTAEA